MKIKKYHLLIVFLIGSGSFIYGQVTDNSHVIMLTDTTRYHFFKEFKLSENDHSTYSVNMFEDSVSYLQRKSENGWTIIDTLTNYTIFGTYNNVPRLEITDFNRDGYNDLIVVSLTNVNGNQWGKIFIYNSQANQLQIIKSAEDTTLYWTNGIWSSPEYNPKDSTITCTHFTSMNGLSYTSKYKLIGNDVIPLEKDEVDDSKMNSKGIGSVQRHYKGKNGKWKKDWQR